MLQFQSSLPLKRCAIVCSFFVNLGFNFGAYWTATDQLFVGEHFQSSGLLTGSISCAHKLRMLAKTSACLLNFPITCGNLMVICQMSTEGRSEITGMSIRGMCPPKCKQLWVSEDAAVTNSLKRQDYLYWLIESICKHSKATRTQGRGLSHQTWVPIPYIKDICKSICHALLPLNITATYKPFIQLQSLIFKPKDSISSEAQARLVYK